MVLHRCWSRRKTQNNIATAVLDRQRDLPDFCRPVWVVRNAVNLQEVDTPRGILPQERVVPGLTGLIVFDSPTRRIPGTGIVLVGSILSFEIGTLDWRIAQNAFSRNPTDDMNAELQSLGVDPVSDLLETRVLAILEGRWKACRHRNESAILIEGILEQFRFGPVLRIDHVPAFVNDRVGIPERLQLRI